MSRTLRRSAIAVAVLAAGVTWCTGEAVRSGIHPQHEERRLDALHRRRARHEVLAARSDQRRPTSTSSRSRGGSRPTTSGTRPEYKLEGTPLAIKGVLYTTAGTRRSVVALDGKTGELIWSHSYREGTRAAIAPRQLSGRGVSCWTDGKGDERVLYVTTGLSARSRSTRRTGAMIPSFGENGVVDLKSGAVTGKGTQIDLETG